MSSGDDKMVRGRCVELSLQHFRPLLHSVDLSYTAHLPAMFDLPNAKRYAPYCSHTRIIVAKPMLQRSPRRSPVAVLIPLSVPSRRVRHSGRSSQTRPATKSRCVAWNYFYSPGKQGAPETTRSRRGRRAGVRVPPLQCARQSQRCNYKSRNGREVCGG